MAESGHGDGLDRLVRRGVDGSVKRRVCGGLTRVGLSEVDVDAFTNVGLPDSFGVGCALVD